MFRPIQKTQVALGFRHIFNDVKARDITLMRAELTKFLGSPATFFRYRLGKYPLNPRQQKWIKGMVGRASEAKYLAYPLAFPDIFLTFVI